MWLVNIVGICCCGLVGGRSSCGLDQKSIFAGGAVVEVSGVACVVDYEPVASFVLVGFVDYEPYARSTSPAR